MRMGSQKQRETSNKANLWLKVRLAQEARVAMVGKLRFVFELTEVPVLFAHQLGMRACL